MAAQPVEWVLVVYYGPAAHRATYGRQVKSKRYTKDYIQLSRKKPFLDAVTNLSPPYGSVVGPCCSASPQSCSSACSLPAIPPR